MDKVVLFVAYGGGHINMLIPLIKEMASFDNYKIITLGLTTSCISLEKHNIPYIGYKDILEDLHASVIARGEELASSFSGAMLVPFEETVAYLGLSFDDLVKRYGFESANKRYQQDGRNAFLPLTVMERLLQRIKPNLVIATNSPRTEKAALLVAGDLGIPSICLMDLFDSREIDDRLGLPGYGNKICVFSNSVKQKLMASGRPFNEIEVTGNPDFDVLNSAHLKREALKYRTENFKQKYIVLWVRHAGKPNFELNKSIDDELVKIASKNKDILFIFRPHPNEPKEYSYLPDNVVVNAVEDIQLLLRCSDLVLTIASTVGLQAVACGIPLITFDMGPTAKYTPYSKMGMSCGISVLNELEMNIRNELQRAPKDGGFKTAHFESATDKILKIAKELLNDKQ